MPSRSLIAEVIDRYRWFSMFGLERDRLSQVNMTVPGSPASTHIEVIPAAQDQEPILANLLELYTHDFSEFHDVELGVDGRFGYRYLSLYWIESDRYPFLVKMNGKLAGFVLIKRGSEVSDDATIWDMTEFFIIRKYRRYGIGTHAAHEVWRRFPGRWEIRVLEQNHSGHKFWERAIATFLGRTSHSALIAKGSKRWQVFAFESMPAL